MMTDRNVETTEEVSEGVTVTSSRPAASPPAEFGGGRTPVDGTQEAEIKQVNGAQVQAAKDSKPHDYPIGAEHVRVLMLARHDSLLDSDLMVTNQERHKHMVGASGGYQTGLMRSANREVLPGRDSWDALHDLAQAGLVTYEVKAEQLKGVRRPVYAVDVKFTGEGEKFLARVEEEIHDLLDESGFERLLLTSDASSKRTLETALRTRIMAEDPDAYPTFTISGEDGFSEDSLRPSEDS